MKTKRNRSTNPDRISVVQRRKQARIARARKSAFAMYFFTYSGLHPDERVDQEAVWTRWQALSPEERAVFEESSRRCWD